MQRSTKPILITINLQVSITIQVQTIDIQQRRILCLKRALENDNI